MRWQWRWNGNPIVVGSRKELPEVASPYVTLARFTCHRRMEVSPFTVEDRTAHSASIRHNLDRWGWWPGCSRRPSCSIRLSVPPSRQVSLKTKHFLALFRKKSLAPSTPVNIERRGPERAAIRSSLQQGPIVIWRMFTTFTTFSKGRTIYGMDLAPPTQVNAERQGPERA